MFQYTTKIVILLTMVFMVFAPFGQLMSTPTAHADVVCKQGPSLLSFPDGTNCRSVGAVEATPQEVAAYRANPSGATGGLVTANPPETPKGEDFGCSASGFVSSEGFAVCVAALVYYIGPGLASNVAYVSAYFFSYTISLSLNSVAYALDFLSSGWTTVRDLANMAFILILVYIAFMIMFQAETTGTIRMLAWVIFIALIINFSFFLTRVVIDAGNILSVQFYNAIPQGKPLPGTEGLTAFSGSGVKDLSDSVMKAVSIQSLFSAKSFQDAKTAAGNSVMGGLIVLTLVYLSVAIMFWILFFVFLQVGIKFLFRVVVLWFIIISAPLALVAKAVPQDSVKKYYDMWQSYLIKFSFYPAIFLFIYLIMVRFINQMLGGESGNLVSTIFNSGTLQGAVADQTATVTVASAIAQVSIRMGFIVAMFYIALKASDWIVEEGSNAAANITGKLTGAALGTAAFANRTAFGHVIGSGLANSKALKDGGVLSRGLWNTGRLLRDRTYDVRNVPGIKRAAGALGGDLIKGTKLDVGQGHKQTGGELTKKFEAVESFVLDGRSEAAIKDAAALDKRVADIDAREDAKKLGKLNKEWDPRQKDIDAIKDKQKPLKEELDQKDREFSEILKRNPSNARLGEIESMQGPLTPAQIAERDTLRAEVARLKAGADSSKAPIQSQYDKLEADKKPLEALQEKLRTEREPLVKRVENMSGSQIATLGTTDIGAIIKQISDGQLKAIKESQKYTGQALKDLSTKWHEENKKAPMVKSKEELGKLEKIHAELEKIGIDIKSVPERGKQPGGEFVITTKAAKDVKEAFENEKDAQDAKRQGARTPEERKEAQMAINQLNKAIKKIDTVIENLDKVPEKVGDAAAPGEYKTKNIPV